MASATLSFFPVGNGAMALVVTEKGRKIVVDLNIRAAADNPDDDTPDVAAALRKRLTKDSDGRLYVDALLISHPDQDHCRGLRKHFHLGSPDKWSSVADKIFVRELWSSPMVFRRASKRLTLCADAKAFAAEARRRVRRFREVGTKVRGGDRILILGEDADGKTDDLDGILVRVDDEFSVVNGQRDSSLAIRLLGPLPADTDTDEETFEKNASSTILRLALTHNGIHEKCLFLTGGDAGVAIWERLWNRHESRADWLCYDILQAPHHCSWHTLSHDSWSDLREKAKVSEAARNALGQARSGATVVASSEPVKDDDNDPPCIRAKREYEAIVAPKRGSFKCVGEHPSESAPAVLELEITAAGVRECSALMPSLAVVGPGLISRRPQGHGRP